jgi:3-hydroxyisobutyrate dehydrogenase
MTRLAFIGLGHMGSHMCRHLVTAGFSVSAFDLSPDALDVAARDGARAASSVTDCVRDAEVLVTSLPGPPQVEAVLGEALAVMPPGSLAVEMSTSSLEVGRWALSVARERGVSLIDAPVAGQTIGAEAATLAIYVGGEGADFARALPVLSAIGDPTRIFHMGPNGSGYAVKLLLNLMWFEHAVATAEALTMGVRAGVELDKLWTALVSSPANSVFMERDVRMVLDDGDYDEGFAMKLVTKDLGLAVGLADDVGVPAEMARLVDVIHQRARAAYGEDAGEMSVVRLYEDAADVRLRFVKSS